MNPNLDTKHVPDQWLSMSEAADHTPYSAEYLSLLARRGKLSGKKVNGVWYTTKAILEDYMQKQMVRAQVLKGNFQRPISNEQTAPIENSSVSVPDIQLQKLRSFHSDIRAFMEREGLPLPPELAAADASGVEKQKTKPIDLSQLPYYLPQVPQKNAVAETVADVRNTRARDIEQSLERVLDKKLGNASFRTRSAPVRAWKHVSTSRVLLLSCLLAAVVLTVAPVPFVFSAFENSLDYVKHTLTDANTVLGARPGTHKNEILLLDNQGNIAISGHVDAGQLTSSAPDGTAPIVVDSKTLVNNLNASYLDGASSSDFTLAFVTQNGAVTTEDVTLGGSVDVGKTLEVHGAEKLLGALSVGGSLKAFGPAEFEDALSVAGPATFKDLVAIEDNLSVAKNISVRGALEAGSAVIGASGSFGSIGISGDAGVGGDLKVGGDTHLAGSLETPVLSVTSASATSTFAGPVYFAGQLSFGGSGLSLPGTTTLENLLVTGSSTINNLNFENATGTNATTTNFSAVLAHIASLAASDISVDALTAGSSTTTNATSTTLYSDTGTFNDLFVQNYEQNNGTFKIDSSVPTGDIFSVLDNAITDGTLIHQTLTANAGNGQVSKGQIIDLVDGTTAGGGYSALTINVTGSGTGSGQKTLLDLNPGANKEIVFDASGALRPTTDVSQNTVSIGSPSFYFKNGYFDTITSNNIAGTVTSGDTASHTWTLGSTETGDASESLVFQRNSGSGNATLSWNASSGTQNDQRFLSVNYPFNATYTITDSSIATSSSLYSGLLTNNTTSGTQKLLSLTNTGTGTTENGIYIDNTGTAQTGLEIHGTWATGIKTNNNSIDAGSGQISTTGALLFGNATGTSATTTNFFATNGAFTNLSVPTLSLTNLTYVNATGTNSTTTNSYSTTASSTNLFASVASVGGSAFNVSSGGNVGIGLTNPSTKLVVAGGDETISGSTNGIIFANGQNIRDGGASGDLNITTPSTGGKIALNTTNGNIVLNPGTAGVGIGTTTIASNVKLDVNGPIFSGTPGQGGIYITGSLGAYGAVQAVDPTNSSARNLALEPGGGNVGIGTTTPQAKLSVSNSSGDTLVLDKATGADIDFQRAGVTNAMISSLNGDGMAFYYGAANTEAMRINSSGNVGIGTTNPGFKLDVQGSNSTINVQDTNGAGYAMTLYRASNNTVSDAYFGVDGGTSSLITGGGGIPSAAVISRQGAHPIQFGTNNVARMTIDSAGNVGIGITNPNYTLQENGTLAVVTVRSNSINVGQSVAANDNYQIVGGVSGGAIGFWGMREDSLDGLNFDMYNNGSGVDALHISQNGNVGIGTTAPGNPLEVVGPGSGFTSVAYFKDLATNGNPLIQIGDAAHAISIGHVNTNPSAANYGFIAYTGLDPTLGQGIILKSNGNVGIGVTNPGTKLHVVGTGDLFKLQNTDGSTANQIAQMELMAGTADNYIWTNNQNSPGYYGGSNSLNIYGGSGSPIAFFTNAISTPRVTIDTSGNVGIGITNPSYKLDVNGTEVARSTFLVTATGNFSTGGGSNDLFGFGLGDGTSWDTRPGGATAYTFNYHTGLTFSAHSAYGGIRFYNQSYPSITGSTLVMDINNSKVTDYSDLVVNGAITNPGNSLTIGTYGSMVSPAGTYGTIALTGAKGGWYGVNFGNSNSQPTEMFDSSGNGGIYHAASSLWEQYFLKSTQHLNIMTSADLGYTLGVNGSLGATNLTLGGPIFRGSSGQGYLNGNYPSSETGGTSGAIYSIGGAYVPGTTSLGNMYGIGYSVNNNGTSGFAVTGAPADWGMYVAAGGTAQAFIDGSTGSVYSNGDVRANNNLYARNMRLADDAGAGNYMDLVSGNNSVSGMRFEYNNGTSLGYTYGDSSGFGLLSGAGGWALRVAAGDSYVQTLREFYPGTTSGTFQASWYIAGNSTYGLQSNTGFNAQGGLYDVGSRVCSGQTCNIGSQTVTAGAINASGLIYSSVGLQLPDRTALGDVCNSGDQGKFVDSSNDGTNILRPYMCTIVSGTPRWSIVQIGTLANPDIAEYVPVQDESISGGEILSTSDTPNTSGTKPYDDFYAERATAGNAVKVLGIVSTNPGQILNTPVVHSANLDDVAKGPDLTGLKPLALAGRVPVKVTTENGEVHVGDYVTVSDTMPGEGMKAVDAGEVVGQALDDYDPSTGEVLVLVGKVFWPGQLSLQDINNRLSNVETALADATSTIAQLQSFASTTSSRLDAIEALLGGSGSTTAALTLDATTTQSITGSVLAYLGASVQSGLTHFGSLVVDALTIGSKEHPTGITLYDTITGDPYCLTVVNGVSTNTAGECGTQNAASSAPVYNPLVGNGTSTPSDSTASSTPASNGAVADTASSTPDTTASSTPQVSSSTASSTPSTTATDASTQSAASSTPVVADSGTSSTGSSQAATSTTP